MQCRGQTKRILCRDRRMPWSQAHVNVKRRTIRGKHRLCLLTRLSVHRNLGITPAKSIGIVHVNQEITGGASDHRFERSPILRQAGIDHDATVANPQSQYSLDTQSPCPRSGAGVPSPATTSDMRRDATDIGGDYIWLHEIPLSAITARRMADRVEKIEDAPSLIAIAEFGKCQPSQAAACVYCPPFSRIPGG